MAEVVAVVAVGDVDGAAEGTGGRGRSGVNVVGKDRSRS